MTEPDTAPMGVEEIARLEAMTPIERARRLYRALEMSAGIMRDRKRTGGWEGADRTADAFARQAESARVLHNELVSAATRGEGLPALVIAQEWLSKAADQFAFYADEHAKKGTPEADAKAATNHQWALKLARADHACRAALSQPTPALSPEAGVGHAGHSAKVWSTACPDCVREGYATAENYRAPTPPPVAAEPAPQAERADPLKALNGDPKWAAWFNRKEDEAGYSSRFWDQPKIDALKREYLALSAPAADAGTRAKAISEAALKLAEVSDAQRYKGTVYGTGEPAVLTLRAEEDFAAALAVYDAALTRAGGEKGE